MPLTDNQKAIILQFMRDKPYGGAEFNARVLLLAEASDAQIANQIQQYAAERKATLLAKRAELDAEIALYEAED